MPGSGFGIGLRLADLLGDGVGIVGQVDARIVGLVRLRHLLGAVAQAHHARRRSGDDRFGQREEIRHLVIVVELLRDVARQLQMLLLVFADRHMRRLVDEDVGRHQHRIGVEADAGALLVLAGFLLELGHAVEPAEPRHAIEDPGKLGMCGHRAWLKIGVRLGSTPAAI